jgi:hypothetical protein
VILLSNILDSDELIPISYQLEGPSGSTIAQDRSRDLLAASLRRLDGLKRRA